MLPPDQKREIGPGLTSAVEGATGGYGPVFIVATAVVAAFALLIPPIRSVRQPRSAPER